MIPKRQSFVLALEMDEGFLVSGVSWVVGVASWDQGIKRASDKCNDLEKGQFCCLRFVL